VLPVGTVVALVIHNRNNEQPIGVVIGYKHPYNEVEWLNGDKHKQQCGSYFDASLHVLSEVQNK